MPLSPQVQFTIYVIGYSLILLQQAAYAMIYLLSKELRLEMNAA